MILGAIPARYGSTRFPGKALARIDGKPMVQWVWQAARKARRLDRLVVATDDPRILEAVKAFGGEAVLTSPELRSGTDRVWEAARGTRAQIVVNIQGDEPLLVPAMVDRLVEALEKDPGIPMATLRYPRRGLKGYADPHVVKVVTGDGGVALYFSRAPIPAHRSTDRGEPVWYKHIGIYAYRRGFLQEFVRWPASALERTEGLEQLRALERGVRIQVVDSPADTVSVDTPEDIKRVGRLIRA